MQTAVVHKVDHLALFDVLLHQGMTKYRPAGSKASLLKQVEAAKQDKLSKKGAIFAVRKKADFTDHGVKGYIITSKETLLEHASELSHFTPNIYRTYTYKDSAVVIFKALKNAIYYKSTHSSLILIRSIIRQDILLACLDDIIGLPTFIVATDRGYQVYFVLSSLYLFQIKTTFEA